jgi:hypothetical protein
VNLRAASRSGGRLGPRPGADEVARIGPRPKTDQAAGWGRGRGRTGLPFLQVSMTTGVVITVGLSLRAMGWRRPGAGCPRG